MSRCLRVSTAPPLTPALHPPPPPSLTRINEWRRCTSVFAERERELASERRVDRTGLSLSDDAAPCTSVITAPAVLPDIPDNGSPPPPPGHTLSLRGRQRDQDCVNTALALSVAAAIAPLASLGGVLESGISPTFHRCQATAARRASSGIFSGKFTLFHGLKKTKNQDLRRVCGAGRSR